MDFSNSFKSCFVKYNNGITCQWNCWDYLIRIPENLFTKWVNIQQAHTLLKHFIISKVYKTIKTDSKFVKYLVSKLKKIKGIESLPQTLIF